MLIGTGFILVGAFIVLKKLEAYRSWTDDVHKQFAERIATAERLAKVRQLHQPDSSETTKQTVSPV